MTLEEYKRLSPKELLECKRLARLKKVGYSGNFWQRKDMSHQKAKAKEKGPPVHKYVLHYKNLSAEANVVTEEQYKFCLTKLGSKYVDSTQLYATVSRLHRVPKIVLVGLVLYSQSAAF